MIKNDWKKKYITFVTYLLYQRGGIFTGSPMLETLRNIYDITKINCGQAIGIEKDNEIVFVMVLLESMVSGHQRTWVRERLADKVEKTFFDPYIQLESVYKERKKIKSMKV